MATQAFRDWLVRHEEEIAAGVNDLGDLRGEFEMAIGRTPGRVMYPMPEESDPLSDVEPTAEEPSDAGDPATGEG